MENSSRALASPWMAGLPSQWMPCRGSLINGDLESEAEARERDGGDRRGSGGARQSRLLYRAQQMEEKGHSLGAMWLHPGRPISI